MNFRLSALLLAVLFAALPLSVRAESWFQEARRIRREADAVGPRSASFEIVPDSNFAPDSVSAGALFKEHGDRVIVRHVRIQVRLPVRKVRGQIVYKERGRDQNYTGEPKWSGRWREPWTLGFFDYTVTATYKGNVYTTSFKIGQAGVLETIRPKSSL